MAKLFANSGDPAASDLGHHCLPITFVGFPDYNGLKLFFRENDAWPFI